MPQHEQAERRQQAYGRERDQTGRGLYTYGETDDDDEEHPRRSENGLDGLQLHDPV